jgi:hypothetical protein
MVKVKNVNGLGAALKVRGLGVVAHGAEVEVPAEMVAGLCAGGNFAEVAEEKQPARKSKKETEKPEKGEEK